MTRRDDTVPMRHMLDHAREAIEFGGGKTPEKIESDRVLNLALAQLVQIVGGAADCLSPETRAKHPTIDWQHTVDTGVMMVQDYDTVGAHIVHDVIHNNLPPLVAELERILSE